MQCRLAILLAVTLGCGSRGVPDVVADADPESPWAARAALPVPVQETAVVAFADRVWVLGGFEAQTGQTDRVWIYDPADDSWSAGPALPSPAHHLGAVVFADRLYVVGGLTGLGFNESGEVWSVAGAGDDWTVHAAMPAGTARGAGAVVALDELIYVIGGFRDGVAVTDVSAYSPVADSWSSLLAPVPGGPRDHLAGAAFDGQLYAVGGRNAAISAITGRVDRYDPASDSWAEASPMPTARAGAGAAAVSGLLVVAGGEGADGVTGVFSEVEAYDATVDQWTTLPPMRTPRHGMGAAGLQGTFYVPGGADIAGFGAVDVVESLAISR